ncbi:galactonate dehydratase, partial [Haloparvum sedimenti]|uniref:galactonate dehydratase n=1 Tax=Haloparvum sedimenti TaxID=1678448 RepID=UPI00071E8F3C
MIVTDYELFAVPPRWLFLKLETDEGVVGWGEPIVEGRTPTIRAAVEDLVENHVIGEDPNEVERLWYRLHRASHYRGGPILMSAIAGIDQALWDIRGKAADKPVYELLGGPVRDRVRVLQWISGDRPDEIAESAVEAVDKGYTAVEMMMNVRPSRLEVSECVERARERLDAVVDAAGDSVEIAVDFRGRVSPPVARRLLPVIEDYDVMFIEEPVLPEHNDSLYDLSQTAQTSFATGQRLYSRWDFKELLESHNVDIFQPSVAHAGGITEIRKIANMCEPFDISLIPKCPVGPIAFAVGFHLNMAIQNAGIQEQHDEIFTRGPSPVFSYLSDQDAFTYEDGYLSLPDKPGLGIDVDEEYVREQARDDSQWRNPLWHHEDGSIAN